MLCGTAPYYGTGARADARIRTSVRIRVSILKPGTASFLKLKCKKHTRTHSKVARVRFSSKAVVCDANPDPDPWVRIRKENPSKLKMQMIPDPDVVRIRESYQTKGECLRIRILESGFGNFYADPRFASDPYRTVRIPSSGSDWATFSCVCKGIRHLDHP